MADFRSSLSAATPAPELHPPLAALWWAAKGKAAKGKWDEAHNIVMNEATTGAAWVHAYLHRVEGDLGNAGSWYRRAQKPVAQDGLDAEWERIASALLGGRA